MLGFVPGVEVISSYRRRWLLKAEADNLNEAPLGGFY
jgi:hypothetical protein